MTKNPFINAVSATGYITLVALFMFYGTKFIPPKDTILMPIAVFSLLPYLLRRWVIYFYTSQLCFSWMDTRKML